MKAALVVSDTSPLRALHHLSFVDLLGKLFTVVLVPPAVASELLNSKSSFPPIDVAAWEFIRVQAVSDSAKVAELLDDLQAGESNAIALALEVSAPYILMDESDGRAIARAAGLIPIGVLGLLIEAKKLGLITQVLPHIDRLIAEINFFISEKVRIDALRELGELP